MNEIHAPSRSSTGPHRSHDSQPRPSQGVRLKELGAQKSERKSLTTALLTPPAENRLLSAIPPLSTKDVNLHRSTAMDTFPPPLAAAHAGPLNISKLVQHARAPTDSKAWAGNSHETSPTIVGSSETGSPPSGFDFSHGTLPSALSMRYFSQQNSVTSSLSSHDPSASDQVPEPAWEDDSSAVDRSGTDSYSRHPGRRRVDGQLDPPIQVEDTAAAKFGIRRGAEMAANSSRLPTYPHGNLADATGNYRSQSSGNQHVVLAHRAGAPEVSLSKSKPSHTHNHSHTHSKVRNSERAKELAKLEMAARQIRAQMAAESDQSPSSDSGESVSIGGRSRTSSMAEHDLEHFVAEASDAACSDDIAGLRQQILSLQRSHIVKRQAHSGMGDYTYTDVDNDDDLDHFPSRTPPQAEAPASDRRRGQQHHHNHGMTPSRSETSYNRGYADRAAPKMSPSASSTSRFLANDVGSSRLRNRQQQQPRPRAGGRRTPTLSRRDEQQHSHDGPFQAADSDEEDEDDDVDHLPMDYSHINGSRTPAVTTPAKRAYRRRGSGVAPSLSSSPPSGKSTNDDQFAELSNKIEMLEQMIVSFGTSGDLSHPHSVVPGQRASLIKQQDRPTPSKRATNGKARELQAPPPSEPQPPVPNSDDDLTDNWGAPVITRSPVPPRSVGKDLRGATTTASGPRGGDQSLNPLASLRKRASVSSMATVASGFRFNITPAVQSAAVKDAVPGPDHGHSAASASSASMKQRSTAAAFRNLFSGGFTAGMPGMHSSSHLPATSGDGSSIRSVGTADSTHKEVMLSFSRKRTERVAVPKAKIRQAAGRGRVYVTPVKE
ncbi:unnamed protein product [Tilletia laevis]|uniref:Uncharacterized protein n=3 Tax=Tilletia TaxID=13289 RepID=A0A8X7SX98_9BASI|nr:hypothetical protein CF328_g3045 [Tilletia controversa]KAE8201006.1 hypothetical protein CF336_g420 [Tilletia laevis]KAE8258607.1 hypothetical protein A4X03_0g4324 [Tilletia caries]KAE8205010.1 hypothetical protein CF335_g2461 [Tilletia laevis]KAE8248326.1 hypothetical protein A4X06_0g3796 [Tilletia controversa]